MRSTARRFQAGQTMPSAMCWIAILFVLVLASCAGTSFVEGYAIRPQLEGVPNQDLIGAISALERRLDQVDLLPPSSDPPTMIVGRYSTTRRGRSHSFTGT